LSQSLAQVEPAKWSTACLDWEQRIVAGESLIPIAPLFPSKAQDAMGVFCSLQVTDLPRKKNGKFPTLGEIVDPNVLDLVAAIFGAEDPKTGRRLIRNFMLLISKKNGKSTIAAGVMLTALIINWRENAELMILAPTIEIATNSFDPAVGMVRADPELDQLLHIISNRRTIRHRHTGATLKIVAADSDTASGKKAGMVLIEELWLFGKKPKSAAMLLEALGGLAARPEGFVLYITTHSDEQPAGVFQTRLNYFRDVRDGVRHDPETLGVLYEWPAEMLEAEAYLDPENFYIVNPHLGRSVTQEWLTGKLAEAQYGDGEDLQLFLAKHLNVEIGLRLRRDRWMAADYWDEAGDETLTFESLAERCEVLVAGIDGGGADDLFGFAVAGREKGSARWLIKAHAWARRVVLERRKEIASALEGFAADGNLTFTETGQEIIDQVAARAAALRDTGLLPEQSALGLDAWGMGALVDALEREGFDTYDEITKRGGSIQAVRQGVGLTGTIKTTEFKLVDQMLVHDGSAMMRWCVSHAKAELKGSNIYISKQDRAGSKIDPLMAMFNALQLLEAGPVAAGDRQSIYEKRGMVVL